MSSIPDPPDTARPIAAELDEAGVDECALCHLRVTVDATVRAELPENPAMCLACLIGIIRRMDGARERLEAMWRRRN